MNVAPCGTTESAGRTPNAPKGRIGAENAKASVTHDRRTQAANAHQLSHEHQKGTKMKNILLTSLDRGRTGIGRARTGRNRFRRPVGPIARRCHGQPTAGAGLQGHRQPRRLRCGEPVHAQRGSPWPDLLADRLRCARSPRRPCHLGDQQDRLRRRHLLTPDPRIHLGRPQWETPAQDGYPAGVLLPSVGPPGEVRRSRSKPRSMTSHVRRHRNSGGASVFRVEDPEESSTRLLSCAAALAVNIASCPECS